MLGEAFFFKIPQDPLDNPTIDAIMWETNHFTGEKHGR